MPKKQRKDCRCPDPTGVFRSEDGVEPLRRPPVTLIYPDIWYERTLNKNNVVQMTASILLGTATGRISAPIALTLSVIATKN